MKIKLNKNGRLSKGGKTRYKQLQAIEYNRQQNIIQSFSNRVGDKTANARALYKIAGVTKQHLIKTNESRSINCPKSRFTAKTKKASRKPYSVDTENWKITEKPKEWVRLNKKEVNILKIITKIKYW